MRFAARKILACVFRVIGSTQTLVAAPLLPLRVALAAARAVHRTVDSVPLATAARRLAAPRRNVSLRAWPVVRFPAP